MNFQEIFKTLGRFPNVEYPGPASPARIAAAQDELRIVFPGDFKLFLNKFGTLSVSSEEIFGLGGADHLDIVTRTKDLRLRKRDLFPGQLLPLRNDGFGNYDCILMRSGDFPIIQWNHEDGSTSDLAPTFEVWLFHLLDMVLKLEADEKGQFQ